MHISLPRELSRGNFFRTIETFALMRKQGDGNERDKRLV